MSAANDNKLAYSPAEAAQALGIGRSTIFDLMKNGQLRRVKIGAKTVIPRSSLEALLAESSDAA